MVIHFQHSDLNHFYSDNSSNFDTTYSALYAYDGDESNGSNWTEYYANSSGNYIAPGQEFFVASKSGGGTVNFDTDMQVFLDLTILFLVI